MKWEGRGKFITSLVIGAGLAGQVVAAESELTVVINEIMWDGAEYVEFLNTGEEEVLLEGWSLARQRPGKEEELIVEFDEEDVVEAGGYFLLEKNEVATEVIADKLASKLTLLNSGEQLRLVNSGGLVVDVANQVGEWWEGENTEEGVSMERREDKILEGINGEEEDSWQTAIGETGGRVGTPGEENSAGKVNAAPEAVVSGANESKVGEEMAFSAEDSSDVDGDELTYEWDFGDGSGAKGVEVTHVFGKSGDFTVRLMVGDGELMDEATWEARVEAVTYSEDVVINEFLPNPVGADGAGEFIALKNVGSEAVDLSGWQLDDVEDGGSAVYEIEDGVILSAGEIKSFSRKETKIALNNGGDAARLLAPDGKEMARADYDDSEEGVSYIFNDGEWVETTTAAEEEDEDEALEDEEEMGKVAGEKLQVIELAKIRDYEKGAMVETEGVVSVPPGALGSKILYLAGSGVQVYLNSEEWPELKLGDRVKVTGEISSYLGETRLKLAAASDLGVVGEAEEPVPHEVKTGEIDEDKEGWLVVIAGEVAQTSGDTFYVDDGSGEVKVVIKSSTEIDKPKMSKGTKVTVIGVVSETTSGYRVLPRRQEDVRLGIVAGLSRFPATGFRQAGLLLLLVWALLVF